MKWERIKKYVIAPAALVIGVAYLGWMSYTLKTAFSSKKSCDIEEKQKLKVTKTLGVVVDSSLSDKAKSDFISGLQKAVQTYKNQFNIHYNLDIRDVDIPKDKMTFDELYSFVPEDLRKKGREFGKNDYILAVTDGVVLGYEEYDAWWRIWPRFIFVHRFLDGHYKKHLILPQVVHEIGHSLIMDDNHERNPECFMHHNITRSKKFCKCTIETILCNKSK